MENKSLGMIIREERKKKGLTQAQLGKLIGLKESRVSKIEHGAPITPEVASFILGKMGSALQINVVDNNSYDPELGDFVVSVIANFADEKKISLSQAYTYIVTFKGMDFLRQHQDIEKTLSNHEIVNDVSRVCANNGGRLGYSAMERIRLMITDKLEIEKLLVRLTDVIAKELHLSTLAAVGAVCMSKVANSLKSGNIPEGTSFDDLSKRLIKEVTMAG
jgi:transcriptional regulator with XRE-family HTH domain